MILLDIYRLSLLSKSFLSIERGRSLTSYFADPSSSLISEAIAVPYVMYAKAKTILKRHFNTLDLFSVYNSIYASDPSNRPNVQHHLANSPRPALEPLWQCYCYYLSIAYHSDMRSGAVYAQLLKLYAEAGSIYAHQSTEDKSVYS